MANEFGEFNYSGVFIDINKNESQSDVAATMMHETIHKVLASSSSIGMLDYLFMNMDQIETDKKKKRKINDLYQRVSKSSIKVQECTAVLTELLMLKWFDKGAYQSTLRMYIDGKIYYDVYGFKNLSYLLDYSNDEQGDINIARNIQKIAILSMNVCLDKMEPLDQKNLKCIDVNLVEYNANFRFMKVIKYIFENRVHIYEMYEREMDKLFEECMLPIAHPFSWEVFKKWANEKICIPFCNKEIEVYINYSSNLYEEEILSQTNGYNSSDSFSKRLINSEEEIKSSWTPDDILYIQVQDNAFLHVLINIKERSQSLFFNKFALTNLASVTKMLFMDRNHYEENISRCPKLLQFDTFVDLANIDPWFEEFIKKQAINEYYIQDMNDQFCVIFLRGSFHTAFYLLYPKSLLSVFVTRYAKEWMMNSEWWNDDFISIDKMNFFCDFLKLN